MELIFASPKSAACETKSTDQEKLSYHPKSDISDAKRLKANFALQ